MERLTTGALDQVLSQAGAAIEAGAVNMISVEAIRARSGDRWSRKRAQVESFVERAFGRLAAAGGLIVALNDAEFVTVQPTATRAAALSVSANLIKETLAFFLGAAGREDMRLYCVTSFINGELGVLAVDAAGLLAGEDDGDRTARSPPMATEKMRPHALSAPPAGEIPAGRPRRPVLMTAAGVGLDLQIRTTPIWNVRARAVTSFLLHADLTLLPRDGPPHAPRPGEISAALAGEAALQLLNHAQTKLASGVGAGLHLPLPLSALSYSTSRYRILRALQALDRSARRFILLELLEVQAGLPQGRLAELVAMAAPYCRAVLARAPSVEADLRGWRRCGLGGITVDCGHLDADDRNAALRLAAFAGMAEQAAPACVAYGLRSPSIMLAAWGAGFTHLSGPAVRAPTGGPLQGLRLPPEDLYGGARTDRSVPSPRSCRV